MLFSIEIQFVWYYLCTSQKGFGIKMKVPLPVADDFQSFQLSDADLAAEDDEPEADADGAVEDKTA